MLIAAVLAMAAAMGAMIWQRRPQLADLKVDGFRRGVLWRALLWESALLLGAGCSIGALFGVYGQLLLSHALATVTGFPVVFSVGVLVAFGSFALVTRVAVAIVAVPGYRRGPGASGDQPAGLNRSRRREPDAKPRKALRRNPDRVLPSLGRISIPVESTDPLPLSPGRSGRSLAAAARELLLGPARASPARSGVWRARALTIPDATHSRRCARRRSSASARTPTGPRCSGRCPTGAIRAAAPAGRLSR